MINLLKKYLILIFGKSFLLNIKRSILKLANLQIKRIYIYSNKIEKLKKISFIGHHVTCGYYDLKIMNDSTNDILINIQNIKTNINHVGLFIFKHKKIKELFRSASSIQMGCRSQWINEEIFSFNALSDMNIPHGKLISNNNESDLIAPYYDLNYENNIYCTLDFHKLESFRSGYGFSGEFIRQNTFTKNLRANEIMLLSIDKNEEIATLRPSKYFNYKDDGNHYVNHLKFSPSAKYLLFFYLIRQDKSAHQSKCLIYDIDKQIFIDLKKKGRVSHYCWMNDNSFALTSFNEGKVLYEVFSIHDNSVLLENKFYMHDDGHPSYLGDDVFLTDTYPNKMGFQELYFLNIKKGIKERLLKINSSPFNLNEERCDLHPRYSLSKNQVIFDSDGMNYKNRKEVFYFNIRPSNNLL